MRSLNLITSLWSKITLKQKKDFYKLIILINLSSLLELFTLASIIPFLSFISGEYKFINNPVFSLYKNFTKNNIFINEVLFACIILVILAALSSSIRIKTLNFNFKWSASVGNHLTSLSLNNYLTRSYENHITRNSNEVISLISVQLQDAVNCIRYFIQLIIALITFILVILGLLIFNFESIYLLLISGIIYFIVALNSREILNKNSKRYSFSTEKQVSLLREILSSFKQIKIDGSKNYFVKLVKEVDRKMRDAQATNGFISIFTRFLIEGVSIIIIVFYTYYLYSRNNYSLSIIFPTLGTLAFALQKVLPLLQQIYSSVSVIRAYKFSLIKILNLIEDFDEQDKKNKIDQFSKFEFKKIISLRNLSYKYPGNYQYALENINLNIYKGDKVCIVGKTGSGKSTLIEIILGLLKPAKGELFIDNNNLFDKKHPNVRSWQKTVCFVPQKIFLLDTSIAENIAFGQDPNNINYEKLKSAARIAKIDRYIESLPEDYFTQIGEEGVKLSGGQKQRIAIARSIYRNSEVIVFDEATSGLDANTENEIMLEISKNLNNITFIFVTHNKNMINYCDKVFELKKGNLNLKDYKNSNDLNLK